MTCISDVSGLLPDIPPSAGTEIADEPVKSDNNVETTHAKTNLVGHLFFKNLFQLF